MIEFDEFYAVRERDRNRIMESDLPVHGWYRFVLSFPPHLVRHYLKRFDVGPEQVVLDPFCGSGTTLVECKKRGVESLGIEPNPIAHFASSVKTSWDADADALLEHAVSVADRVKTRLREEGLFSTDSQSRRTALSSLAPRLLGLSEKRSKLLIKGSISPLPLHKTIRLLQLIEGDNEPVYSGYERLALASALTSCIGNLKFGPEVGVGASKSDAPVIDCWLSKMRSIALDLAAVSDCRAVRSTAYKADARTAHRILAPESVDAVITSPPYPNEKDYTRTTRLESVVLGFLRDREGLRTLKKSLIKSNTRGVYKDDRDDAAVSGFPEIIALANEIEQKRIRLGKTSGFERLYGRVTKLYFGGMARHLAQLRHSLKPGANLAYVVGDQASYLRVMIRTGERLGDIARDLGYIVIGRDLFRTRFSTATGQRLREETLVLQWPGWNGQ